MVFFRKKKETGQSRERSKETASTRPSGNATEGGVAKADGGLDGAAVLLRPHVTEKASDLSAKGVYVFDIHASANKAQVRSAVEKLYKVKPVRVNVIWRRAKSMRNPRTGRAQMKSAAAKKALVYLKAGDKIEFV